MIDLTHKELKELIEYFPETGEFRWKERDQRWFETSRSWKYWNGRYAGARAGSLSGKARDLTIFFLGKQHQAARVAWFYVTGEQPLKSQKIELIDLNKENLKWENLRITNGKGLSNKRKRTTNKSGITGVFFYERTGKWVANGRDKDGKQLRLGYFDTKEDAYAEVKRFNLENYGDPDRGQEGMEAGTQS